MYTQSSHTYTQNVLDMINSYYTITETFTLNDAAIDLVESGMISSYYDESEHSITYITEADTKQTIKINSIAISLYKVLEAMYYKHSIISFNIYLYDYVIEELNDPNITLQHIEEALVSLTKEKLITKLSIDTYTLEAEFVL